MKYIATIILLALSCCAPAYAGGLEEGLSDPVVTAPAKVNHWTGFYVGVAATQSTDEATGERCSKLGEPKACNDPIFDYYPEYKDVETFSIFTRDVEAGGFIGYRTGDNLIFGVEAGKRGLTYLEAQIGVNAGRVLPFLSIGASDEGESYGGGIDVALGDRWLLGVAHRVANADYTSLRLGLRF